MVLQSGEDMGFSMETLCDVVREIRCHTDLAVTVSVGERSYSEYALLRQAGAHRYLLKHETADPQLYARLHVGHRLADRIAALKSLRDLGFQIGSGFMVGLPGQSVDVLVADLRLLHRLDVDMAGIGPFIAHPDTPLGRAASGDAQLTLKCVAVAGLLLPYAHLPATTAPGHCGRRRLGSSFAGRSQCDHAEFDAEGVSLFVCHLPRQRTQPRRAAEAAGAGCAHGDRFGPDGGSRSRSLFEMDGKIKGSV